MPLLSKFRKSAEDKTEEEPSVEADEEDGLLISVEKESPAAANEPSSEATADEASASQADVDDLLAAATQGVSAEAAPQEETDDLMAAAQGESAEAQPAEAAPAGAAPATREAPSVEPAGSEAEDGEAAFDDPLAAFRDDEVESDISYLTKDIEEISMEELLIGLRQVHALMKDAGNAAESPEPADG